MRNTKKGETVESLVIGEYIDFILKAILPNLVILRQVLSIRYEKYSFLIFLQ